MEVTRDLTGEAGQAPDGQDQPCPAPSFWSWPGLAGLGWLQLRGVWGVGLALRGECGAGEGQAPESGFLLTAVATQSSSLLFLKPVPPFLLLP